MGFIVGVYLYWGHSMGYREGREHGSLGLFHRKRFKYYIEFSRFWGILTATKSLVHY